MTIAKGSALFVLLLMLALLCVAHITPAHGATYSAEAIKAAFLYRFASYVHWPAGARNHEHFVIGVMGSEAVANHLERLLPGLTVDNRPARLRRVARAEDLADIHILYVGPVSLTRSREVREAALKLPILMVTDDEKGFESGGVINFIEINRNVRFEISLGAADIRKLRIDSALLSVAARVQGRPQAQSDCPDPYIRRHRPAACLVRVASLESATWSHSTR